MGIFDLFKGKKEKNKNPLSNQDKEVITQTSSTVQDDEKEKGRLQKDIFLNYPINELISICQLVSTSNSWVYSDSSGGIRVDEKREPWLDFVNDEDEVFQVNYEGEGQDPHLVYMKSGDWMDIHEETHKLIIDFFINGNISKINEKLDKIKSDFDDKKNSWIREFDTDGNGVVDVLENNDFSKLLKSKQKTLIEFEKSEGKSYVQNFIKLSRFLSDKSQNIQNLFETIKEEGTNIPNSDYLDFGGIIRNQIHTYNLMLISSLNMIISLNDDDRITFYEIYESFDKLNVFQSNHEKEVSMKLNNIENKLEDIIQSIHNMETSVCNELMTLQFISEDISETTKGLSRGLSEIKSSLNTNNILTGIQTYQLYKINKNTRGLR